MKNNLLLKQFEYSIPQSTIESPGINGKHSFSEHLPLMKIGIDFENGVLKLEGNWHFMILSNKENDKTWLKYHKERVEIETDLFSSLAINLDDPISDGFIFPLKGKVKDGNRLLECSGLLAIDNVQDSNGIIDGQWNISFYLYLFENDACEIKFKFPIYVNHINERDN